MRVYKKITITSSATASTPENTTATGYTATANIPTTFSLAAPGTTTTADDDNDKFDITSAGVLTFKAANVPDFENPADVGGNNVYNIQITATAGSQTVTKDVTITVTDIDEIAPTITSDLTVSVPENTTGTGTTDFVYTITANEAATFALGTAGGDEALFKLAANKVTFKATPDYEMPKDADKDNVYKLELKAMDAAGNEGKKVLSITVTDVAEQATISLPETLAFADIKVGEMVSKALTISNPSVIALKVTAITFPTGFTGDWSSGIIAAGGKKEVNVSFKPTEAKSYPGTITVSSDAANAADGKNTLTVSGKGILVTGITAKGGTSEPQSIFPGLSVFPNPAEDVLNVKLPNQTLPVSVQLVDINGQVVYEQEAVTTSELRP